MAWHFPIVQTHNQVWCFNCGEDLGGDAVRTHAVSGDGQYKQHCSHCHMTTWYDLADDVARMLAPRARLPFQVDQGGHP